MNTYFSTKYFYLFFILSILLFKTPLQAKDCSKHVDKKKVSFISSWPILDKDGKAIYEGLGLKIFPKTKESFPAALLSSECLKPKPLNKTYAKSIYTLFVTNTCQERIAKELGFKSIELQNYGSMEAGKILNWKLMGVCLKDKSLISCDPSSELACTKF